MKSDSGERESGGEVTRRKALALLGVAGMATLTGGCPTASDTTGDTTAGGDTSSDSTSSPACVVTPAQTEGPYFVDELLNRSDIRSDPASGVEQAGVPLRLKIRVQQVSGSACNPLDGALVDVWHCNAAGVYSDVSANRTLGQKFLRGYQLTDGNGEVEFLTIYPGWYSGRTVHIHFKVRTFAGAQATSEFTSQLYFDETVTAAVFSQTPYRSRGSPDTSNARDGIFNSATLLTLTPEGQGYLGVFDIGLRLS